MPGLVPGIHVFLAFSSGKQDVDGRDKPGHDAERVFAGGKWSSPSIADSTRTAIQRALLLPVLHATPSFRRIACSAQDRSDCDDVFGRCMNEGDPIATPARPRGARCSAIAPCVLDNVPAPS